MIWRLRFGRPVQVAVTTLRLVGEAEIQLRRHSLHLILLELETSGSVQLLQVSLQGRLPKPLQTAFTSGIHNCILNP